MTFNAFSNFCLKYYSLLKNFEPDFYCCEFFPGISSKLYIVDKSMKGFKLLQLSIPTKNPLHFKRKG